MNDIFEIEAAHSSGVYAKHQIAIMRGEGARVWDSGGKEYIDCVAGHGVASLGHAHPAVAEAIAVQARRLITCHEAYYNDQRAALLGKLARMVPELDRVFLCNSGTEATEAALKFARLSTGRSGVVAAMRGFHGRTMGALSATWNKHYREPFLPLVPGFSHVPFNNVQALADAVDEDTAAVILEVVQGEGGVHVAEPGYLEAARAITSEHGALLIIDEVQTGLGRTGKLLALEHFDLVPDMVCIAKSLAGGLPIGAVLIGPAVRNLAPGLHGSTFGGNPLVCAAALAALEVIESEDLPGQAAEKGAYLLRQLNVLRSPLIREVRGLGLMVGIELKSRVAPYLTAMAERGVLAFAAGLAVVRLLPPLVITHSELDQVVEVLRASLSELVPETAGP
ncbi:MAG: aspartate aminotransferase family protein [Gemmatimonadales bacterium]